MHLRGNSSASEEVPQPLAGPRSGFISRIASSIIGLVLFLAIGLGIERTTGMLGGPPLSESDQVSQQQSKERKDAFYASEPIQLRRVLPAEESEALDSMKLTLAEQHQLALRLGSSDSAEKPRVGAAEIASPQQTSRSGEEGGKRIALAWITVWDTDATDQDMIRLDSEGYSYTVTLSKSPATVAVPIPYGDVINITGLRDGGGGITVGVMSGTHRVLLPLMSEGQVIGIPVNVP